jgi:hypothetical protein
MKLVILTIFVTCSLFAQAQTYKPLLDQFNEWRFTYCFLGNCSDDTYYTDGDMQFGGYQYKILDGYHFISRTIWLREDTSTQKVYLSYQLGQNGRRENLLYDFALQVGDSIDMKNPLSPFLLDAGYYTLDSILMDQLNDGNYYRHYYLSPSVSNTLSSNTAEWIEGVGSLSLINAPSGSPDLDGVGKLSCFFKSGSLFYSNLDSTTACIPSITLNIDPFNSSFDAVSVYPTFVEKHCLIKGIKQIKNIAIYNANGSLMLHKRVSDTYEIDLNLEYFSSGIYFLVLSDKQNRQACFKLIKD